MAATEEKKSTWWTSLPGILTAIAATITAITGLVLGLHQIGVFGASGKSGVSTTSVTAGGSDKSQVSDTSAGTTHAQAMLKVPAPVQLGGPIYTILAAKLAPYSDGKSSLTLTVQVKAPPDNVGYLYGNEIVVEIGNMSIAGTVATYKRAAPDTTEQSDFVFVVPSGPPSCQLLFRNGDLRQTVPFSLLAP